jgi:hypothetical protein
VPEPWIQIELWSINRIWICLNWQNTLRYQIFGAIQLSKQNGQLYSTAQRKPSLNSPNNENGAKFEFDRVPSSIETHKKE